MSYKIVTHGAAKALANAIDPNAKVVHGKFLLDTYGGTNIIAGVACGDLLVINGRRRAVKATVIVIIHEEMGITEKSPEDFMEDPTP